MKVGRTLRAVQRRVRRERGAEAIDLEEDELYSVLADSRRRFIIERLASTETDPPTCAELAVEIAADETHMDPELVPARRVEPVEEELRNEHLPLLSEVGLARWEGDADVVRPGHAIDAVADLLGEVDRRVRREPPVPFRPRRAGRSADANEPVSSPRS